MGLIVRFKTNPTIERIETRPTFECPECGTPLLIDRMKLANGEYEVRVLKVESPWLLLEKGRPWSPDPWLLKLATKNLAKTNRPESKK